MRDHEIDNNPEYEEQMQSDQLWLRELLLRDSERFQFPEALKSQNLLHRLEALESKQPEPAVPIAVLAGGQKKAKKPILLKYLSYAACVAIIGFGWYNAQQSASKSNVQGAADASKAVAPQAEMSALSAAPSLMTNQDDAMIEQPVAKDYNAVYDALNKIWQNQSIQFNYTQYSVGEERAAGGVGGASIAQDAAIAEAPMVSAVGNAAKSGVYGTNVQIAGVDEADIVKTDGVYIYQYRFNNQTGGAQIAISTANGLKLLSTIELPEYANSEIYISANRLIVVQAVPADTADDIIKPLDQPFNAYLDDKTETAEKLAAPDFVVPDYYRGNRYGTITLTEAVTYDITDHKNPKELIRYCQDGNYVSSRLVNDTLYLVTNKYVYSATATTEPVYNYLPVVGEPKNAHILPAEDIIIPPYLENTNYAVVSALNLNTQASKTKAVLGMADQIMMSQNNLFLTATVINTGRNNWYERDTGITRFSVNEGGLQYLASGKVKGYIDNQFSLDEYNGNLRIATTSYDSSSHTQNNVYVLDRTLKQIGAVENLAKGERIYSVRYIGNTAYVVTFRETDPLFVIDLSNPVKPVVKGELKIPGFSEYLHPIDENTLVGLGMNTVVTKYGDVATDGLKLSLFDVSDPTNPVEKSSYLLGNNGSTSEALSNHKAFMYYPEQKLIGFPATIYTTQGGEANNPWAGERTVSFAGYLVIKIKDNGFDVVGTIPNDGENSTSGFMRSDSGNTIERGIYIGKTLYTTAQSRIMAFNLDNFKQIGELKY